MRNLGEQFKAATVLAADGFGQQFAGQVGGVHAVAGIGLCIKHIGLAAQSADLRQAVGADADHAAPLVVDTDVSQLRKHFQHLRPHVSADVLRITARVMTGAAEQQAAVSRESVVIHRHALIADRHVLRQQAVGLRFTQRLGGDDVTAGGQDFATEFRVQVIEVSVAAQHQGLGAHRT